MLRCPCRNLTSSVTHLDGRHATYHALYILSIIVVSNLFVIASYLPFWALWDFASRCVVIDQWHAAAMMTSSNGRNIFRVTGPLCGEFTGPGEFPAQRPVTRSFDVYFDLRLNKRWSKQPWGWWFGTPSWPLWRQCNGTESAWDWAMLVRCVLRKSRTEVCLS